MLPTPPSTITSMSSTTVDGRTITAGVPHSSGLSSLLAGLDEPSVGIRWKKMTSGLFGSMSWRDITSRYLLKSPNNCGDLIVKLEIFRNEEVQDMDSQDMDSQEWWKHAEVRGMVAVQEGSQAVQAAEILRRLLINEVKKDRDVEGKTWSRK